MSSKLFPYKLVKGQWFRAESCTESDIAVIVDTTREMIWFWEGTRSSARGRSNARDMLGQLKKKYIVYKFKRVTSGSPEDILERLEDLREKSFTGKIPGLRLELKDFSKIFYFLNIISSFLMVSSIVLLWLMLFGPQTEVGVSLIHYSINFKEFTLNIDLISLILLLGFAIFVCSSLFGYFLKKKSFSSMTLIALCFIFIAFFMVRIWDISMFYENSGNNILIRKDVFILFVLSLNALIIPGIGIGLVVGILGLKNLRIIEAVDEEEAQ
jgi:hypothetical protein